MSEFPWAGTDGIGDVLAGDGARAAVDAALTRIEAAEPEIQAWVRLDERATERADELDRDRDRGGADLPLSGVPIGVKDIIDVAGLPTRCGSPVTSSEPVAESAACVRRFEALGAVVLGKTVTTEFAYFQPGPTRNPWSLDHTPGGSSSGSAAAVAAGMVPLALGTQTAASLIRPAAYCGVAGLVLGNGTADLSGIVGLSPTLDSLGLLARSVDDLTLAHAAFTGADPEADAGPMPDRLLVWTGSDIGELDDPMRTAIASLPDVLSDWSVTGFDQDDHIRTLATDHVMIMGFEAARERAAELEAHGPELSQPLFELLDGGKRITEDDYWQATYRRDRSRVDLEQVLQGAFVIGPAALGPAPAGLPTGSPIMSRPWQALGFPTVAVPGFVTEAGLPVGIQMVGPPGSERTLLAAASRVEKALRAADPLS